MKNFLKKTVKNILTTVMIILIVAVSTLSILVINKNTIAKAEGKNYQDIFKGYKEYISKEELYNLTNTYNYTGLNESNQAYYDVSDCGKNGISVSDEAPQITVLTHGLGESARTWSNISEEYVDIRDKTTKIRSIFAYDNQSIIEQLSRTAYLQTRNFVDYDNIKTI